MHYFTPSIAFHYANTIFSLPSHQEWLTSLIYDSLELQPGHIVVDMGCGPGQESTIMLNRMQNTIRMIGECGIFVKSVASRPSAHYLVVSVHLIRSRGAPVCMPSQTSTSSIKMIVT
jgi:hypothetical protein